MWVALHVNCFTGDFIPVGPFSDEREANEFSLSQDQPKLWVAIEVQPPPQEEDDVPEDADRPPGTDASWGEA